MQPIFLDKYYPGNEEIQDNSDYSEAKAIINREPTSHETAKRVIRYRA